MIPKEKADELVKKMIIDWDMCKGQNVECALIAVDELIDHLPSLNSYPPNYGMTIKTKEFWEIVKKEIKKI
jgi:hypothetical protein